MAAPVMLMGDFGQDIIQGPAEQVMQTRRKAYVVVFNKGTAAEGVYTLETSVGRSKGKLLMFENMEDAGHYAQLLQGEEFTVVGNQRGVSLDAQPFMWDTTRIAQFCHGGNFEVALVPSGGTLMPPEKNVLDPARFGATPPSPRAAMRQSRHNQAAMRQSMHDQAYRSFDQHRRAQDMQRGSNDGLTPLQKRGRDIWDAAMRNAQQKGVQGSGNWTDQSEPMCGGDGECGLDKLIEERAALDRLFYHGPGGTPPGTEDSGPRGPGPEGPGPEGPGPWGPGPRGPWGP